MRMFDVRPFAAFLAVLALFLPAKAQDQAPQAPSVAEGIAAVVNDTIISTYDLNQRILLLVVSSGTPVTEEALPRLQQQALNALIDDRLKLQEAAEFELTISDEELGGEIERIAAQNGISGQQLIGQLASQGVNPDSYIERLRSETAWNRLVNGRFGSKVRITDEEIDQILDRIAQDSEQEQYLVSEIFLPVRNERDAEQIYNGGLQLIAQMQQGAPFPLVARQFSASSSAAVGGDIGWVRPGELADELDNALQRMTAGAISAPIPSEGGFYILALRQKRSGGGATAGGEDRLQLVQIATPAGNERRAQQRLAPITETDGCASALTAARRADDVLGFNLGEMRLSEISPAFRPAVNALAAGKATKPLLIDGNLHMLVLCGRNMGPVLAQRGGIENRLFNQQIGMFSQRYLRDLRRDASIEIRLADG